jgi:plastocyanin
MTGPRRLAVLVSLLALVGVACYSDVFGRGSDNPVSEPPRVRPTATTNAAPTSPPAGAAAPAGGCAAAAGLTEGQVDHGSAPASGAEVAVKGGDVFFEPTCTTGLQAGTVKVKVRNTGFLLHNFSVTDQGIDKDVDRGQTIEIDVKVDQGPVRYFCKYHKAAGMVGALIPG